MWPRPYLVHETCLALSPLLFQFSPMENLAICGPSLADFHLQETLVACRNKPRSFLFVPQSKRGGFLMVFDRIGVVFGRFIRALRGQYSKFLIHKAQCYLLNYLVILLVVFY